MIDTYYRKYLGYNDKDWSYCEQRDMPLNQSYYYRLIATHIDGKVFYSVSNDIRDFQPEGDIESTLVKYQKHYKIRRFNRMHLKQYLKLEHNLSKVYDMKDLENAVRDKSQEVKKKVLHKYHRIVSEKRRFVIRSNEKTLALASVSDIDCGGGNITVYTHEDYRKLGYGKMLVASCVEWCLSHDIEPIYLVDADNHASMALACALGFETFSQEYALSECIDPI